MKPAGQTTEIR